MYAAAIAGGYRIVCNVAAFDGQRGIICTNTSAINSFVSGNVYAFVYCDRFIRPNCAAQSIRGVTAYRAAA